MFAGAYTALITPFGSDGSVDYGQLRELVEFQIAGGIDGLVPVGTTGESPTLDLKSTSRSSASWSPPPPPRQGARRFRRQFHGRTLELTARARDVGADGTLQVTPYYNKPTQAGLIRHFSAVAELGLPVVLYNVPGRRPAKSPWPPSPNSPRIPGSSASRKPPAASIASAASRRPARSKCFPATTPSPCR
jgi:4-hydroxy-tetrahydrodipicolinate synthase